MIIVMTTGSGKLSSGSLLHAEPCCDCRVTRRTCGCGEPASLEGEDEQPSSIIKAAA